MPGPRHTLAAACLLAALPVSVLAGCGDDGGSSELAQLAPPDSPLYAEVALFPDDDRTDALASLTDRIGGLSDPEGELAALIDGELEGVTSDVTYDEDIKPWLGDTGAAFVRSFEPTDAAAGMIDAAYMLAVSDTEAAQTFIDDLAASEPEAAEEREYEGIGYTLDPASDTAVGLVDSIMVIGTEPAFKAAVDAQGGDSLADADDFSEESGSLDDENLAEVWVDLGTALDAAAATGSAEEVDAARAALEPLLSEPIALSLAATEEAMTLEASAAGGAGFTGNSELLGGLPGSSWLAVAVEDAGASLQESLSGIESLAGELGDPSVSPDAIAGLLQAQLGIDLEDDLLSWIGNAAFSVSGTSPFDLRAGALLETSDPEATGRVVDAGKDLFEAQAGVPTSAPTLEDAVDGFTAQGPGGASVEVALLDDVLIGAFGGSDPAGEFVEPEESLEDAELYSAAQDALSGDFEAVAFVGLQDFLTVAEQGDDGDTDYDAARPYTENLSYVIFGTAEADGRERSRLVVGVEDE